jgi:integrase
MKKNTFLYLLTDIIDLLEKGDILNYGKRFSPLTISSYKQLRNGMKRYNYNFNIEDLDLNNVNSRKDRLKVTRKLQSQVNGYLNLMLDDCKHPNTRKSHLKNIRSTLKKAEAYYGYLFPKLQSMRELQTEVIALTPDQVEMIHNNNPGIELENVWYYTRLMLYSCMRISDLTNFQATSDGNIVTIITKKGMGSLSTFYLPDDVNSYIAKNGTFAWSLKSFRRGLKELLQFYPEFMQSKTIYNFDHDGNPVPSQQFLYELITPHKLRSSGITYHLSKGLSEMEVRRISGHANGSEAFYRYVRHSDTESLKKQEINHKLLIKT